MMPAQLALKPSLKASQLQRLHLQSPQPHQEMQQRRHSTLQNRLTLKKTTNS